MSSTYVYGVHAVKPAAITATAVVFHGLAEAERHAKDLSTDPGVLAAAVTQYGVGEPGRRTPVAMYVNGTRQTLGYISDDRRIYAGAHGFGAGPRD